jgi:chitin disaccharide deacetylase
VPRYLIVNGDDLGASRGVNRGVLAAYRDGILTSASLMVDGPAAEEAAALARAAHGLSVGLHLVLDDAGTGAAAIAHEVRRQLDAFCRLLERPPTHLDTHHHRHRDAEVLGPVLEAATELGVALREHGPIRLVSRFYGRWDGASHPEQVSVESLLAILREDLIHGVSELACHPGYVDDDLRSSYRLERALELQTLCSPRVRATLDGWGVRLVNAVEAWALTGTGAR